MSLAVEHTLAGYQAALTGAAFYRVAQAGYLRLGGPDRFAFVQRQTTNDIKTLAADRALMSVLTSATARILDVWRMVIEPDSESVGVITLPGRGPATARYLQKHVFFMDKVTVTDASADVAQIELLGPETGRALSQCGLGLPEDGTVVVYPFDGGTLSVVGLDRNRALLLVPQDQADSLAARLEGAEAEALSASAYEALRVEAGQPGPLQELTDEYTPLEMNLDVAISSVKGCYTGQEIIARQITYDKVTRRLVGLRLESPVDPMVAIQVDGRTVGAITSVAASPRWGLIALAVIKRPHHEPGTAVTVLYEGRSVSATTTVLPFAG
jgi:folate-binding protein YgfZ